MIDLRDVTFMIPVRVESEDRKEVLTMTLNYMKKHLLTKVIVCEEGQESKIPSFWNPSWDGFVTYIFRQSTDALFHKTKNLNYMARMATTPIIAACDSDVVFHPDQYLQAVIRIRAGTLDFCYPFNQPNYNISNKLKPDFAKNLDLSLIDKLVLYDHPSPPPGGCFIMSKQKFIEGGMENENFVSWGPEDVERRDRFKILGYRIGAVGGKLFHIEHSRTENSLDSNVNFENNNNEYKKVLSMPREKLKEYISTWPWAWKK